MRELAMAQQEGVLDYAMNNFAAELAVQQQKGQRIKRIMECRRQLELRREQQQLAKEICEFDFSLAAEN